MSDVIYASLFTVDASPVHIGGLEFSFSEAKIHKIA